MEFHIVKPWEKVPDRKTIKEALQFALDISKSPEKWIISGYKSGFAGYELWINALKENRADAFGTAYNAATWAECRKYAVEFLKEAKHRLSRAIKYLGAARDAEIAGLVVLKEIVSLL